MKKTKEKGGEQGGLVMGKPLCTVLVWAWLIACFFIHLYGSLCVEGQGVTWLMSVGVGERKNVRALWVIIMLIIMG